MGAIVLAIFVAFIILVITRTKRLNKNANSGEKIIGTIYFISLILFAFGMVTHSNPYYQAIDPVDMECYSPFSNKHAITLLFYFLTFNIAIFLVWTKSTTLPPLTLTLSLVFIVIGGIVSIAILYQISKHDTQGLNNGDFGQVSFLFAPLFGVLIGTRLIIRTTALEISETSQRVYSNKYLNILNTFLLTKSRKPIWLVILIFPVFFIVTLLLILFGQDANSIVKVFTDTATWKLSQHAHPPILDHQGHYLCTVAACGHPKIVKPLQIGQRNGRPIIVNRQLQIANAFEELIKDLSPKLHYLIRYVYDKYGYNISKKINTAFLSDITYILMKPLEWLFLICLYLFSHKPEQKINKQYNKS